MHFALGITVNSWKQPYVCIYASSKSAHNITCLFECSTQQSWSSKTSFPILYYL